MAHYAVEGTVSDIKGVCTSNLLTTDSGAAVTGRRDTSSSPHYEDSLRYPRAIDMPMVAIVNDLCCNGLLTTAMDSVSAGMTYRGSQQ